MRILIPILKRVGGVVAAGALAAAVLSAWPGPGNSPYVSALASLATGRIAEAASKCSDRTCDTWGTRCVHLNGSHTDCGVGDFCRTRTCT